MSRQHLNTHIRDSLATASQVAGRLMAMGITVLSIKIGTRNPRIQVQPGHACRQLPSAIRLIHGHGHRREETKTTYLDGAQIEWRETA